MTTPSIAPAAPQATPATSSIVLQLAGAAALGVVLLYGVAFADSPLAHNAAHDVRHVTVKPCH
jgi:cobalt transporter subunit CbtB